MARRRPFISFLSDFGPADPSAAICRGIILARCPEALLLDITHDIAPFAVRDGAVVLWCALPYLPVGVCLAVVDPGVGTERRPIAIRAGRGDLLVGPDNGLLVPVAEERLGGIAEVRLLDNPALWRGPVSSTFHGRDIFAPVAAHLASGTPLDEVGSRLAPHDLVRLPWPRAEVGPGRLRTAVLFVDRFGNVKTGALAEDLRRAMGPGPAEGSAGLAGRTILLRRPGRPPLRLAWRRTFGDEPPGTPILLLDSYDRVTIAVSRGSAREELELGPDDPLELEAQ